MRTLRWLSLLLAGVALLACVAWWWLFFTNSGARFVLARAASIEGLQITGADGSIAGGLDLRGVRFANDGVDLGIDSLSLTIDVNLLPISIDIVEAAAHTIRLALAVNPDAEGSDGALTLEGLVLPFPLRIGELRAQDVEIARGEFLQALDSLAVSATWYEEIRVHRLAVIAAGLDAEVDAVVRLRPDAVISSNARVILEPVLTGLQRPVALRMSSQGDLAGADVQASVESFVEIDGHVGWLDGLTAAAGLSIDKLDLSDILAGWPAGFPVDGELRLEIDDTVFAVRDAVLRIDNIDSQVEIDAKWRRESGRIDGRLQWENLRWPLEQEETRVRSESADLRLNGSLEDWKVAGSIAIAAGDLPPGVFDVDAHGDSDGASGRIVDSNVLGGHIAGEVAYTWRDAQPWQANLDLDKVDLAWLFPDWPAVVSGRLDSAGTVDPFAMRADLQDVRGELRGEMLQASGIVEVANGNAVVRDMRVEHGDSLALLDGALMMPEGLQFDVRVNDLSVYARSTAGGFAATGSVSLADAAAFLRTTVRSAALSVGDQAVTGLEANLDASFAGQSLQLAGAYRDVPFRLLLTSALADWRKPFETQFECRLETFDVDLGDENTVTLSKPAIVRFMADLFAVEDFCIADRAGASLCADANWRRNGDYDARVSLQDVPVNIIRYFTDTALEFEQRINGAFEWEHRSGAAPRGSGQIRSSAGNITVAGDPASAVATGDGILDFQIEEGRLLRGDVRLPFPGRGDVAGDFSIADVTLGTESGVSGNLVINLSTIRVLSSLTRFVDNASGALQARVILDGSVARPHVSGEFSLDDGGFKYRPIGLELAEVNVKGTMDQDFRFDLSGTFRAGKGVGEIVSRADYDDGGEPGLMFQLRGTGLTLVNVPDVFIEADTDIDIAFTRETLAINGEVTVPNALIKPRNITVSQVNESDDVVIVAGELPQQPEEDKPAGELEYQGELNVSLGKSVLVDLDLAKANITGAVNFNWQGDAMPIATGRYQIDGSIEAYGQVLDVSEGSVHFPNVPADRPYVRVMAEREIFGNTQVKRAGVLVDGPIRRPTIEAYTRPQTTEERAVTLLVTGSDFDFEQGVGAIDFGAYIAPRLFVSYGVGVFERENIISARFDLARGFGIKATSGSNESGIDLSYRFEN